MNALALGTRESLAMTARSLRGVTRQVDSLLTSIITPILLMLLFVYVFGGAISIGTNYRNYSELCGSRSHHPVSRFWCGEYRRRRRD